MTIIITPGHYFFSISIETKQSIAMDKNKKQDQPNKPKAGQPGKDQNQDRKKSGQGTVSSAAGNESEKRQSQDRSSQQAQDRSQQTQDRQSDGSQPGTQGGEKQSGEWQRPLTNQDEQRKPTNAGNSDSPMGEEETEGDPGQERIKPYKNIGDDSKETEKKEPTMGS
jgi:hypothetical protein